MALLKYGGGIVQMSGSMAGNTYARNKYGNYMRARTKPVNPNSDRQVVARARVALLVQEWNNTLTAPQRTAWGSYAAAVNWTNKLGETINLSGFNMFVRSNMAILYVGDPIVAAGPVVMALPPHDPVFSIAIDGATNQITTTFDDTLPWCTEDGGFLQVHLGSPQNASRTFFNGPWRLNSFLTGIDPGGVASPAGPAGINAWTYATGQRAWAKARIIRADGRISTEFEAASILCT